MLDFDSDPQTARRRIRIPARANIAADTVGLHADGPRSDGIAVRFEDADGTLTETSFASLDDTVRRVATLLRALGVERGDVVAIHSGARAETVAAHLAVFRLGAVAATLSQLYGQDTVRHVLQDSGAGVLVTQDTAWRDVAHVRADCAGCAFLIELDFLKGREKLKGYDICTLIHY